MRGNNNKKESLGVCVEEEPAMKQQESDFSLHAWFLTSCVTIGIFFVGPRGKNILLYIYGENIKSQRVCVWDFTTDYCKGFAKEKKGFVHLVPCVGFNDME